MTGDMPRGGTRSRIAESVCLLLLLSIAVPAFGQATDGAGDAAPEEAGAQEGATAGMLPVPDYTADWKTREFLSGDWGGTRTQWANKGVTFDLYWLNVGQGVVDGGLDTGSAFATSFDIYINLDLMRMQVLPGALISFRGQSRFGNTVNGDTGLLLPVNTYQYFPLTDTLDEDVPIAITELNYTQFLSEKFGVLVGKITTMRNANEFAGGEGRTQFMNFQFIYPSVFGNIVPYSTLAAAGVWLPSPNVTVTTLLMNTADASTTSGFSDIGEGTDWWTSIDYQYRLGGRPGGGTLGFVYAFDGDFARIGGINIDPEDGISLEQESETWALFWDGWQYLYTEEEPPGTVDATDGRQDLQGVGVFLFLGIADRDTNPVLWTAAGGLSGRGTIPGRDDDTWGVGYFYNELREVRSIVLNRLANSTQGLEAYYSFALAGSVALTIDFQWTRSAFAALDDAIVLGARLNIRF